MAAEHSAKENTEPCKQGLWALTLRRPDFRRLWASGMVSQLGDWLSYIAISLVAFQHGEGVLALAMVLVAHTLPHALLAPVAGPLADRLDRRKVMIATNLIRSAITLAMALAASTGEVVWLEVLLLLRVSVSAFSSPAREAALPRTVDRDELGEANALMAMSWSVLFTAGVALGGLVAALVGPALAIVLDAGTFLVSTAFLLGLSPMPPERSEQARLSLRAFAGELKEAWDHALDRGPLMEAVLAKTPIALAGGGAWITLNLAADTLSHAALPVTGALGLGLLHGIRGAGTGFGPWLVTRFEARWPLLRRHAFIFSATFAAIGLLAVTDNPWVALVAIFVWGAGAGANWVVSATDIQRQAPDQMMGRMGALDVLFSTLGMSIGALAGAWLVDLTGMARSAALVGLLLGLSAWGLPRRPRLVTLRPHHRTAQG